MKNQNQFLPSSLAAAVLFANAGESSILTDSGGNYKSGQVLFANDSRFLETYYSEPVTNYVTGWKDPENLDDLLEFLAPKVPTGRRFEWKAANNAEEFLSETFDDTRAIGADFKTVRYTGTDVTDKTLNKGLTVIVDLDNVVGTTWQRDKAAKLQRRLMRNEVRRALALISAAAVNNNKTWDGNANPDLDVKADLITAADITGIRPNRTLYGDSAFQTRSSSYESQNNAGAYAAAFMDEAALARRLMVDKVVVSKARYQSSASAKTQLVGNKVISFFAESGVDVDDPSNVKRFVSEVQGGGDLRVYVQQLSSKLVAITVEHYSKSVVTYANGIRQFTIS